MSRPCDKSGVNWDRLWEGISLLVGQLDLTSRSSTKFDDLSEWVAQQFRLRREAVVCKFVQYPKNRWNRLREALRLHPTTIFLFFEGEDSKDTMGRVCEAAAVCAELEHVLVLLRSGDEDWRLSDLFVREGATIPEALACAPVEPIEFTPIRENRLEAAKTRKLSKEQREDLVRALHSLSRETDSSSSQDRGRVAELLAFTAGVTPAQVAVKTIPSSKNLGNRLGEALARKPAVFVVVCPEMLESRVLDEIERWRATGSVTLLLVLCGEEIDFVVYGLDEPLVKVLRGLVVGQSDAEFHSSAVPQMEEYTAPWREWSYDRWNRALIDYVFNPSENDAPVERLAATPEELAEIVGAAPEVAADVTSTFVSACVGQMPHGTSFCGFCNDYRGGRVRSKNPWCVESDSPPHFFGMLWFTCLVAYGYPESTGGFSDRLRNLTGKSNHIDCLPELWQAMQAWTKQKRGRGGNTRELVLPPEDDFRTTIGFSHFLAFPHALDRRTLATVLIDAELVGYEPPVRPVLKALQQNRGRFSSIFREDLDNFVSKFIEGQLDVRESAFWRAVRQEALEPSAAGRRRRLNRTTILAFFDDDGLLPILGCAEDWSVPPGVEKLPLDHPVGGFEHYARQHGAGLEGVIESMLRSQTMLGPGPRALVRQGVLVFQEDHSQEYFLVSGHEINGADVAVVRDDLVEPFSDAFGGTVQPFRMPGWSEITGCVVRPLDELPTGLEHVLQLERTMTPPNLRLVGGIKVAGGYMGFSNFLPRVRAPEATSVSVELDGEIMDCALEEDEWILPQRLLEALPVEVRLEAQWTGPRGGRRSERRLRLLPSPIFESYKPLGIGHFFVEFCRPGQLEIEGGSPIPLNVTMGSRESSYDLIEWEPSARHLGGGIGEMSLVPKPGFDWLVIGPKNSPELLLFVGDPDAPTPPRDVQSPHKGDRRHWKRALTRSHTVMVRKTDGQYCHIDEFPQVAEMLRAYRSHRASADPGCCPSTNLDTLSHEPPSRTGAADATRAFEDAVAALSARRSGLRYRTVQALLVSLTGRRDYALHHELIRGWTDSGAVDVVRHQSYSVTKVVARAPRFVGVRRGPAVEASLIGLTTSDLIARVRSHAEQGGLNVLEARPGNPWQAPILRVRGTFDDIDRLVAEFNLNPTEWLDWRGADQVPDHLDVSIERQRLWRDPPPKGFKPTKTWSFEESAFQFGVQDDTEGVAIQQWVHPEQCSIYVVVVHGVPDLWTYIRNWALLHAYDVSGRAPFSLDPAGWVRAKGPTPVHLPICLGRLCAIVGEGVPGPTTELNGVVGGYCYPFGRRVTEFVKTVIPSGWLTPQED